MVDDKTKRRPEPTRTATAAAIEPGLLVLAGPGAGTVHRIAAQMVVGRGEEADLRLDDEGVSRKHVKLIRAAGGLVNVLDLGSTNGVFVNGRRTDLALLQLGDVLELGPDVRLRLVDADAAAPALADPGAEQLARAAALGLTERQLDIARLVAAGLTNPAIAQKLSISPRTVTSHLDHIYTRLGISSRAALASQLATAGLLGEDPRS
ncbi:MAG: LuxR C-terminal-related transcriptional regulator [Nannocystaceae bacterium]|nr:LuxR C-terminal-related transcriptional regulator [Nannocystaceae bacterium]